MNTSLTLLYGIDEAVTQEELIIVSADDIEDLQTRAKAIAWVVNRTWDELRAGLELLSEAVRSWVSEELEWKLDDAWSDTMWESDTEVPERPAGWWPSDEDCMLPFDDQWAESQSGPNGIGLPPEIIALGVNFGSPVSADSLTFFTTQEDEIRNVAESLGLELVRDDRAIMRCWPEVWMGVHPASLQFIEEDDVRDPWFP